VPEKQFIPLGNESAPAGWTLPPSLTLTPQAIFANFDGTGAAGSFIPTLKIVSDSGHTVASIPQSGSVAAGASVEATWGPFLGGGGGGAASSASVALAYGQGAGGATTPAGTSDVASFATVASSSAALVWSSVTHTNDTLTVNSTGALLAVGSGLFGAGMANQNLYVNCNTQGIFRHTAFLTPQSGDGTPPPEGFSSMMDQCWFDLTSSGSTFNLVFSNGSAFANGPTSAQVAFVFFAGAHT
jgi:hypothetical protein